MTLTTLAPNTIGYVFTKFSMDVCLAYANISQMSDSPPLFTIFLIACLTPRISQIILWISMRTCMTIRMSFSGLIYPTSSRQRTPVM